MTARAERDEAFQRWVVPQMETMYRVALVITRDPAEADDVVQDALLRAYQAIDRFDGVNSRGWLLTIVRNAHVNRHRRRRPGLLTDPQSIVLRADRAPGPEETVVDSVFDARVQAALLELSADQQAAIQLVDVGGLSYREAAEALGVPVGTVMSRLHRGRRRIKRKLGGAPLPEAAQRGGDD